MDRPHPPVTLPLTPIKDDARRFIEKVAANRLGTFKNTIDPATGEYLDDPYAQNKSLSEHVAADYHGRFLIELIQNGNDAHPRDRGDGEIEVLLADEGPFGTVYVANRGVPFSERQADALLRIGRSSKPPGEAIGNKGLGFRSVSHVCDAPEIYSQSTSAPVMPSFEGFCFTLEHTDAYSAPTSLTSALVSSLNVTFRCSRSRDGSPNSLAEFERSPSGDSRPLSA